MANTIRLVAISHPADRYLDEKLQHHLRAQGASTSLWSLARVTPGEKIEPRVRQELSQADLVIVFLSAELLSSSPWLLAAVQERQRFGGRVIPVLARPVSLSTTLASLQLLPRDGKALSQHLDPDQAFVDLIAEVQASLNPVGAETTEVPSATLARQRAQRVIEDTLLTSGHEVRGRDSERQKLGELLFSENPGIAGVLLAALGGMGKTTLAWSLCNRERVWERVDLVLGATEQVSQYNVERDEEQPLESEAGQPGRMSRYWLRVARQLDIVEPGNFTEPALIAEIQRRLAGRRVLLLLDNLETLSDADTAVRALSRLCTPPDHRFLITTRRIPKSADGRARTLELGPLTDRDAVRLVILDHLNEKQVVASEEAIATIARVASGHPLALRLLTGKLLTQGEQIFRNMPELAAPAQVDRWLGGLFRFVFNDGLRQHLGAFGYGTLRWLAKLPIGLPVSEFEKVYLSKGMDPTGFDSILRRLCDSCCVYLRQHGQRMILEMHSLTRHYFQSPAS